MRLKKDLKIFQQSVVQTYDAPGLAHVGNRSHNLSLVARHAFGKGLATLEGALILVESNLTGAFQALVG
jgi:hypothetical protein